MLRGGEGVVQLLAGEAVHQVAFGELCDVKVANV